MSDSLAITTVAAPVQKTIKQLVWFYLLLLIFEGALRKWFLPSLATPLLVVRDPVAVSIIFLAIYHRLLHWNIYYIALFFIGGLSLISTLLLGHGNPIVAAFGLRSILLHFPVLLIIGTLLDRRDVEEIGKIILWIIPFMTLLITLQFYSPQSAWVNRGIGGDVAGAGFSGALGYYRPPGTFSFTNGNALFYSLAFCFVAYFWLNLKRVNILLLTAATIGVLIAIPISISRAYLFQIILTLLFVGVSSLTNQRTFRLFFTGGLVGVLLLVLLTQFSLFQTGIEVLSARFEHSSEVEGGVKGTLWERLVLDGLVQPFLHLESQPMGGYGLGFGTNVGGMLLTGQRQFLITEGEWGRVLGEMGILLGTLLLLTRLILAIQIGISSLGQLRTGNILPWILLSMGFMQIVMAGWAQPTSLGFSILVGGLVLASLNDHQSTITIGQ